jgi:hypothetical protein
VEREKRAGKEDDPRKREERNAPAHRFEPSALRRDSSRT